MVQLTSEAKEAIVLKTLNRGDKTIESVARSNNISASTLHKWLSLYKEGKPLSMGRASCPQKGASRAEQFEHLLATRDLDEADLGAYCREHGLYSHQLTQWRERMMSADESTTDKQQRLELKKLRDEAKRLQRELRRKERALAEASALLVLKKKADLIWGVDEDD